MRGVKKNKNVFIHNCVIGPSLKTYINSIVDKDCFRNRNYFIFHICGSVKETEIQEQ